MARNASVEAAGDVAGLLGTEFGWDAAERFRQADAYRDAVARELARTP
jgi:hypothetical protein